MEAQLKSQGRCVFCGKVYTKRGISRHLETHLKKLPAVSRKKSLHLRVEAGPYFLQLLVDSSATLGRLDSYLRRIWLECCGHLSEFGYDRWDEELDMDTRAGRIFDKGATLWYAYDFGSTTELLVRCVGVHSLATKDGIQLLSRNEPFHIPCDRCGKELAVQTCTAHWGEEDRFFCADCSEVHEQECDEADYALYPVVNSPRMGVCGYMGGTIDTERDQLAV